jgi:hypothetical protein
MLCYDPAAAHLATLPSRIFRLFRQPFESAMTMLSFDLPLLAHGLFLCFREALPLCMLLHSNGRHFEKHDLTQSSCIQMAGILKRMTTQ